MTYTELHNTHPNLSELAADPRFKALLHYLARNPVSHVGVGADATAVIRNEGFMSGQLAVLQEIDRVMVAPTPKPEGPQASKPRYQPPL